MAKKLLVVDDQVSMLKLYSRMFSGSGLSCTFACSMAEAREMLAATSFDLLITDIKLGDGCGTELVRLAGRAGCPRSMMVSGAFSAEELGALAAQCGAPAFFCKPFRTEDILSAVTRLLSD